MGETLVYVVVILISQLVLPHGVPLLLLLVDASHFILKYPRIVWIGRNRKVPLVLNHLSWAGTRSTRPGGVPSSLALNSSRDEASRTYLGNMLAVHSHLNKDLIPNS